MAYNDDAVLARLSSLNESHDSIATAAQWIMFHRRHADRTVQLWMQRLKDSSSTKRLSLIYLANEVAQQSRIRHKDDFTIAFSPVIAEAVAIGYKGAATEIQTKLRRVVDVWKDRKIFEGPIQEAIDLRLQELDKARGTGRPGFAGSPFGPASLPAEFTPLVSWHQKISKLKTSLESTVSNANQEYTKQTDPSIAPPSAPVYAARLNGLLKTLANAENAVAESVKARESLILGLEKMLEDHRTALATERASMAQLAERKAEIEEKKQAVEIAIMRALGPAEADITPGDGNGRTADDEPRPPEMEALTPPVMEALTPPVMEALTPPVMEDFPSPGMEAEPGDLAVKKTQAETSAGGHREPGEDSPAGLSDAATAYQSVSIYSNGSKKRRRLESTDDSPEVDDEDGIDADVAEMLKDDQTISPA